MYRVCLLSRVRMLKSRATVRAHASFLSFTRDKRASTRVYLHACIKFRLSCTVGAVLSHHLETYKNEEPELVILIESSLYVDDLICGAEDETKAFECYSSQRPCYPRLE